MTIKTFSKSYKFTRTWKPSPCPGYSFTLDIPDTVSVDAIFSRTRPNRLTPTDMSITRIVRLKKSDFTEGAACRLSGDLPWIYSGELPKDIHHGYPDQASINLAANAAMAKFGAGSFNAAIALAELPQTAGFVLSSLHRINSFAKFLRKGEFQKAAKALSDVPISNRAHRRLSSLPSSKRMANGWLEYKYALMPLVSDVHGAIDTLHTKLQAGTFVRRSSSPKLRTVDGANAPFPPGDKNVYASPVPPRVTVGGWVQHPILVTLQQLGIFNIPAVVWEKIPFSFVIDWFIPIGKYFSSLTAGIGFQDTWTCTVSEAVWHTYYKRGKYWGKTERRIKRRVTFGWLLPSFPFSASVKLSGDRIATLAALIRQRSQ